jgi:hypothetical protein
MLKMKNEFRLQYIDDSNTDSDIDHVQGSFDHLR